MRPKTKSAIKMNVVDFALHVIVILVAGLGVMQIFAGGFGTLDFMSYIYGVIIISLFLKVAEILVDRWMS